MIKELESFLKDVQVIKGTLKVTRSYPLVSLSFFSSLRVIEGNQLISGNYSLYVVENQNLQKLFPRNVTVQNGKMFFHFNPKLCRSHIIEIKEHFVALRGETLSSLDVSELSNGDRVACNVTKLKADLVQARSHVALIQLEPLPYEDDRSLLGYTLYLMPAASENVSQYESRDACGGDGWLVSDVPKERESSNSSTVKKSNIPVLIQNLKPHTRYAYYIKTYLVAAEKQGGQTDIKYFWTAPAKPEPVRHLVVRSNSSSELVIEWEPPLHANGNLTSYVVILEIKEDSKQLLEQRNYCNERK